MSEFKEIGEVEKAYEEARIEWKIADFFSVAKANYQCCPDFTFAGTSWQLVLYPIVTSNPEDLCLTLWTQLLHDYTVKYSFGLKKLDGRVEQLYLKKVDAKEEHFEKILPNFIKFQKINQTCSTRFGIIKLLKVQRRKSVLAPSNVLTIVCTMKRETTQPSVSGKADLISLDTLSGDFRDLFSNKESCDTTLYVKNKEYKAHRAVLIARSSVFTAMFQHEMEEKETGNIVIPDCEPKSFQHFLEYLYCGKLEGVSFHTAFHLYNTSDKYDIQALKTFCVEHLMQCMTAENICDIVTLADKYDELELFDAAQDFFNRNLNQILETSEWECLLQDNYRLANTLLKKMSLKRKFID